ncbi:MAG: NAD-dependent epimerase/dehydratase family protein [Candidatus Marinimicrobia bacterium]|nr:NAD-dependent epimerase/dehydratase family protein [Candidatus Neomarinimicrobiota bacterium]
MLEIKFLVTGGAGFIGSHLVEHLINAGNNILVIDDLSSGYENNISDWLNNSFLKKKVQKVSDEKINSIDGIFHLAAQASVPYSIDNFFNSSENNILSSLKVFSWAKAQNIPVVYASSSAVYGNLPIGDDQIEEYDILSPYAQDKLILENYARMCWDVYKTPSIGLRFFNVYGPRQDSTNQYSGVISIFIDRLIQNKPVIVNGGYQTRDFIFVDDIVRVMIKSMKHLLYNRSCDVFNVGTGVSVTIDQLLEILAEILKVEPEVKTKELPPGDPEKSGGTYGKLTTALNIDIHQFVKLEDGLRNTIDYIRNEQSK